MTDKATEHMLTDDEQEVLRAAGDTIIAGNDATLERVTDRVYGPEVAASSDAMMFGAGPPRDRDAERRATRKDLISLNAEGFIEVPDGTVPVFAVDDPFALTPAGWKWFNANA